MLLLAACGGGGSSSVTNPVSNLSVSGVALTGAAIDSGTVEVKCASGTGTATTAKDGSYTVAIQGGIHPCILKVTDPVTSTDLHSLLETGSVANISPITDLVVSNATGTAPSVAFANYNPAVQATITAEKVSQAVLIVQKVTQSLGVDTDMSGIDPLKVSIRARQGDAAGDATDKKIDAFMAALAAADKRISDLSSVVKSATTTSAETVAKTLVGDAQHSLANCPAARSGDVWSFDFEGSEPMLWNVNFSAKTIKDLSSNQSYSIEEVIESDKPVACAFKSSVTISSVAVNLEFRVSDGGVSAWKLTNPTNGRQTFGLGIPKQVSRKPTSAEFGGTFPGIFFINVKNSTARTAAALKYTIDSAGNLSAAVCDTSDVAKPTCTGAVPESAKSMTCSDTTSGILSCQSSDGLTKAKAALYTSPGQAMMLMSISQMPLLEGGTGYGLLVMNKAPPSFAALPAVGTATLSGWYAKRDPNNVVSSGRSSKSTVTKVNLSAGTYEAETEGFTGAFTYYIDNPTPGFRLQTYGNYRAVMLGSPTGWLLIAGKSKDVANTDWYIGIRDRQ
jgi:hypothetical protein